MENKPSWCNSQRTNSLVMIIAGMFVLWTLSDSGLPNSQNTLMAVGIFLLIYGATSLNHDKKWDALSRKQKIIKIAAAGVLGALVAVGTMLWLGRG